MRPPLSGWLLAVIAILLLSGCGSSGSSGSGDSTSDASKESASATPMAATTSTPAGIHTIEDLRAAVQKAGVSCPDVVWKPNLAPDVKHATAEGVCADTLTLVVFEDKSELGQTTIRADLAGLDLKHALDDQDGPENEMLAGPGWGALGAKPTIAMIHSALGGSGIE